MDKIDKMDYTISSLKELKTVCKERKIKGYSSKSKDELVKLLSVLSLEKDIDKDKDKDIENVVINSIASSSSSLCQKIIQGDSIIILPTLESESAQIIIADPPYNIGKNFGNNSDKQPMDLYLSWCDKWIKECIRILKPNGTMFIYGFSEILALILSRIPYEINRRWILWHYTNKNVPSLNFWQRSHESIIVLWKTDKVFNRDAVREPYTDGFLNGAAGKERKATKGRFSNGEKTTTYTAHANGALPRDVIKIPALAGGAGMNERVNHPTQKPLALCDKLIRSCMQEVNEGYVLVPFAGSGSECLSAKNLNMSFVGIELNPEYITLINQRLEAKKQTEEVSHQCQSQLTNP